MYSSHSRLLLPLSLLLFPSINCYCSGLGANPGWKGTPVVEQISLTSVRVSWKGLVTRIDCADNFIVKYWPVMDPSDFTITSPMTTDTFEIDIKGTERMRDYEYQMIAREDKGIFGVDYNKSGATRFKTCRRVSSVAPHIPALAPKPQQTLASSSQYGNTDNTSSETLLSARPMVEDQLEVRTLGGVAVEVLVGVVMAGLLVLLIAVGILYNCIEKRMNMKDLEMESNVGSEEGSDGDSLEFEEEEEDNNPFTSDKQSLYGVPRHDVEELG